MSLELIKTTKRILLEDLIDIYERRLLKNSNFKQRVLINIDIDNYPKYFENEKIFNDAISNLESKKYIEVEYVKFSNNYSRIILNRAQVAEIYLYLNKDNPLDKYYNILKFFDKYPCEINNRKKQEIINTFDENRSVTSYLRDDFKDLIKLAYFIERNDEEIYERNFSNKVFNDSKRLESLKSQINTYFDAEDILVDKGIVKNPTYLFLKGDGIISLNNEKINLNNIKTPIGISSNSIKILEFENVSKVTTIENLTTFNDYKGDGLIIYLGGFSNKHKMDLLTNLKKSTNDFNHFGDIDYGGFLILSNLMTNLGLEIKTINMSVAELTKYKDYLIPIKDKDYLDKLSSLLNVDNLKDHYETIQYLIKNKIKLEQESISLK